MTRFRSTRYIQLLGQYLLPQWPKALLLAVVLLGGIGMQLVAPQILRAFIDAAREGAASSQLIRMALLFLAIGLLTQCASVAATYLGAQLGWSATNRLREDLAAHCLRLHMGFHNEMTAGQMIERVDGDVTHLSNFFSQFVIQIFGGLLLGFSILGMLFREDVRAGLCLTAFAVVAFMVLFKNRSIAVAAARVTREASAQLFGFLEEKLAGLEDIRANGGGAYVLNRFYRVNHRFFHASRKSWMLQSVLFMLVMGLFAVGHGLALGVGVYLYQRDAITLGTVFLFLHYTGMLRTPLEQITRQLQDLQNATAGIARIDELLHLEPRVADGPGVELPAGPPAVDFEHVSFAYDHEPVLRDLSFHLAPGRSLGLIGRTGSGKTTLARLLFRLYDTGLGRVRLGGVDVSSFTLHALRNRVGMVTQDVQIFNASVRDNLTFFAPEVKDAQILDVIDTLGFRPWFARLPNGLDTHLSAGGGNLSSGEAQLLAFTRIFLRNPGLVILDEPSSRMDPVTERLVRHAIRRLLEHRTAIVIAHRLSTLEMVDDILHLDEGRVLETGAREDLARDPGSRFHHLLDVGLGEEMA